MYVLSMYGIKINYDELSNHLEISLVNVELSVFVISMNFERIEIFSAKKYVFFV